MFETAQLLNFTLLLLSFVVFPQSILQYNGGAVIAMAGENCVGICRFTIVCFTLVVKVFFKHTFLNFMNSDLRLGHQAQTVAMDFEKV